MIGRALHLCKVWCVLEGSLKNQGIEKVLYLAVPISASGPQGDQPLVNRIM